MTSAERPDPPVLLAGDVGASKIILSVFSDDGTYRSPLAEATFHSRRYPSLESVVDEFLLQTGISVGQACFGVAGPVSSGKAVITNLPWTLDERHLQESLGIQSVKLLNDLEAIAWAVPLLASEDLVTLNPGKPVAGGAKGVIAPGTGLGEAYLTWNGMQYLAHPSEGGHTDFGPDSPEQIDLLAFAQARFDHVSCERVCSGLAIPLLYTFFKESGRYCEPPSSIDDIDRADDPTPIIIDRALGNDSSYEICRAALRMFLSILGGEAGNLALKILATGGIYLGGGIPPRILPALQQDRFLKAFKHKGRMSSIMNDIPVYVITTPKAALMGAAFSGSRHAKEKS